MARPVRGCLKPWSQQEGTEPESNPSVPLQEDQRDTTEGEVIVDYDLDMDYERSEHKNEQGAPEENEEDPDAE